MFKKREQRTAMFGVAFAQPLAILLSDRHRHDGIKVAVEAGQVRTAGTRDQVLAAFGDDERRSNRRFMRGANMASPASMAYWQSRN